VRIAAAAYPLDFLDDWNAYARKTRAWVEEAAGQGADLLVFPEYGRMELATLDGRRPRAIWKAACMPPRAGPLRRMR